MLKFWRKLKLWYINNFIPHVVLCASTEQCYISKALWKRIIRDLKRSPKELHVFFEKYPIHEIADGLYVFRYRFFVNSDLSGVKTPDGGLSKKIGLRTARLVNEKYVDEQSGEERLLFRPFGEPEPDEKDMIDLTDIKDD